MKEVNLVKDTFLKDLTMNLIDFNIKLYIYYRKYLISIHYQSQIIIINIFQLLKKQY